MSLHYGSFPHGASVVERDHSRPGVGWYELPFLAAPCSCCDDNWAAEEYEGIATDADGPVHFCHPCAASEGLVTA